MAGITEDQTRGLWTQATYMCTVISKALCVYFSGKKASVAALHAPDHLCLSLYSVYSSIAIGSILNTESYVAQQGDIDSRK